MGLEDIAEVDIDSYGLERGFYKFVLVTGPNHRNYIHASSILAFHRGVFNDFKEKLSKTGADPSKFHCKIGGLMDIKIDKKTIRAYGTSNEYHKFDVNVVRLLLEDYVIKNQAFNGFSVLVE